MPRRSAILSLAASMGACGLERQRLTIDLTVARDFLDSARHGHKAACDLFNLARDGKVEIALATTGYNMDVQGDLMSRLEAVLGSQPIDRAPQLAYLSEFTYPAEDLFPGNVVEGFPEIWEIVAKEWKSHEGKAPGDADRAHIETHVRDERHIFITQDRSLRTMCRRLREEHGVPIRAMTLSDYLLSRSGNC